MNILATVEVPILILDRERRIRRFTPKARSILNVLPSDVGRPIDDIKPNLDVHDLDQQIAEVIETVDDEGVRGAGSRRPLVSAADPALHDRRTTRSTAPILSLVDIDALKHHVGRGRSMHAPRPSDANRAKDEFLATLSHELRTPLSSMLLQRSCSAGDMDAAKLKRAGDAIERGTRTQVQLIDDLLDVSRIVAGKLKSTQAPSTSARSSGRRWRASQEPPRREGADVPRPPR